MLLVVSHCSATHQRFDELRRISFHRDARSRVFLPGLENESTIPVLSHVFRGITRHRETLKVHPAESTHFITCRGETCQQGFTAHVCAAPAAVSISLRRDGVKQEAFCRLREVFIKKW